MDIDNLETFIEVAETRSFSQSAKSLRLTQPAVSKRIASLETALSTKLFDRVGRTVHLTEAGRILLPSAKQVQSELARIEDVIGNIGNSVSGKLTVGTTEFIATRNLPSQLRRYREVYPDVKMDLRFQTAEDVLSGVEQHRFELGLCPLTQQMASKISPRLHCSEIWNNELKLAVAKDDPLASELDLTVEKLVRNAAILPPQKTFVRNLIDGVLRSNNLDANVLLETNDYTTMHSMTSAGLGWTCLPQFQVDDTLAVLDINNLDLQYTVALIHSKDLSLSRAAQMFVETLADNA